MPKQLYLYVALLPREGVDEVEYFVCLALTHLFVASLLQYAEMFRTNTDVIWDVRLREEVAFSADQRVTVHEAGNVAVPDTDVAVIASMPPPSASIMGDVNVLVNLDADSVYWQLHGEDNYLSGRTIEVPFAFFRTFLDESKPTVPVEHTW